MKDKSSTATSKELSQWKRSFKVFFYGTPIIVIAFFIVQICATKGSFSTEFNSLDNWKTFTDTFNLPIGVFTAMAAITTLIGMYYRSLQLAHQLNKVEDQIEIANKQFSKSSEQFELAQKQFSLASRKENFMLYIEHKKAVKNRLDTYLNALVSSCDALAGSAEYLPGLELRNDSLYGRIFSQNTALEMTHFALEADIQVFQLSASKIEEEFEKLFELDANDIHIKDIDEILNIYAEVGMDINFNSYRDENLQQGGIWLASFFLDIMRATMALSDLKALEGNTIQDYCIKLTLDVIDANMPA